MESVRAFAKSGLCLLFLGAFFGCGGDDATDPEGDDSITIPLAVGNRWFYSVTTEAGKADVTADTTTIVGTETRSGKTWYIFFDHSDGDSSFVRQEGREFYVEPTSTDTTGEGDMALYVRRVLDASHPWKFGDFDAAGGESWILADAETTFQIESNEGSYDMNLEILMRGTSEGITSVSVPAGDYTGVYRGRLDQRIIFTSPGGADTASAKTTIWVANGVGPVKNVRVEIDPFEETSSTSTEELTSYSLQ